MNSLYETWLHIAREFSTKTALHDFSTGERWTFKQLLAEGERRNDSTERIAFPRGHSPHFIFSVLRAWRNHRPACPLEPSQSVPELPNPPSWCAHLKLTSATGGIAKSIAFTAPQLAADARNIVTTMGLRHDWPNVACISLAHSYGFSNLVTPLLLHGIPLIIIPAPLPETLLQAVRLFETITLPAVPALWRTWFESKSIPKNTRLAISAGAPLPMELEQQIFSTSGIKVHNFYGSSECGGIAYDRSRIPRTKSNYAGTCMENVSVSLSEAGTLVVSGPAVARTYWPEPQPSLHSPRFETSDLADLIQGRIYLRGRASDLINVAGRKVLPETIESALRAHPLVRECAVFGIPDSTHERTERIVACVSAIRSLKISEMAAFLSKSLASWQIPREWWFTTDLAPNERGKISRSEWRRRFLETSRKPQH
jgi:long-chain acyl-CoA synthetase